MPSFTFPSGRRYERRPVNAPATLIAPSPKKDSQYGTLVLDSSKTGARVKVGIQLTPGQSVWIKLGEGKNPSVRCRVVWTRQPKPGQEAEVGLEFLDPFAPIV